MKTAGGEIKLAGLGKFEEGQRGASGRKPATGDIIGFAASRDLSVTPAKQVRHAVAA